MGLKKVRTFSVSLVLSVLVAAPAVAGKREAYDNAVGQVFAADMVQTNCNGLSGVGGTAYQPFVLAATELTAEQGLRKNKMRKLLFYGKSNWLEQQAWDVLSARGVDVSSYRSLCAFGRSVAGTKDSIGRFLVKE